jgi:cytochrome bd ubiquinol oxidase subunit II
MNPSATTVAVAVLLVVAIAAYALFAGADLGGGIWDLLAGGDERGARPREEIDASLTPVWEGNHVWIIFGLVLMWTGFPSAFRAVMITLFAPLALSLLGIVLRGVGFAFRHESERMSTKRLYGAMFAMSSLMTPFFLGTVMGAVVTGAVPANPGDNVFSAWTSLTAIVTGLLFVATCAYISGIYLVADSGRRGRADMARYFRRRSVAAGLVAGVLAAINLLLLMQSAPYVWSRLFGPALPAVVVSVVGGIACLLLLLLGVDRPNLLRGSAALAVVGVVAGWGVAQYPWILPGALTLAESSAPEATQLSLFAVAGLALLLVLPGFGWLYWLQQHEMLQESHPPEPPTTVAAETPVPAGNVGAAAAVPALERRRALERVLVAVVITGAVRALARRLFRSRRL